jgi:hypothetical protein
MSGAMVIGPIYRTSTPTQPVAPSKICSALAANRLPCTCVCRVLLTRLCGFTCHKQSRLIFVLRRAVGEGESSCDIVHNRPIDVRVIRPLRRTRIQLAKHFYRWDERERSALHEW